MSQSKRDDVDQADATGVQQAAGRVEFDSRGNSVWKWAKDVIDSTSILLKRLENKDLAIEPTQKVPVVGGAADKRAGELAEKRGDRRPEKRGDQPAAKSGGQHADRRGGQKHPQRDPTQRGGGGGGGGGFDPYNSGR
jgi:hypothetical protein